MSVFQHSKRLVAAGMACLVFFGALVRCLATRGELWLDEVWSVVHVDSISSALEIVTKLRHDNNHLLTSLWIYLCGVDSPAWLLRAPSVIFGAATLVAIARWGHGCFGATVTRAWLLLCTVSYPLILYSSEARGYAVMICCAAAGFLLLSSVVSATFSEDTRASSAIGFAAISSIGVLSHATFTLFFAPALLWLVYLYALRLQTAPRQASILWAWLRLAVGPVVALGALLTVAFYGQLEIGGAPVAPYIQIFFSTISAAFGGDEISAATPGLSLILSFASLCVLIALLAETVLWIREGDPIAVLVALLLAAPVVAVVVLQPHFILARYFIFQVVILYLLAARFLVRLWQQNLIARAVALMCTALYLTGNSFHTWQLLAHGRSHFQEMLYLLEQCSNGTPTTLGADQLFQVKLRLKYAQILNAPGSQLPLELVSDYQGTQSSAEYVIREAFEHLETLPEEFTAQNGLRYRAQCNSVQLPFYQGALMSAASLRLYRSERSAGTRY